MKRRIAISLMCCAVLALIAEFFGLYFAKQAHQRDVAKTTRAELITDLGTISSALQSGNQALYDRSYQNFSNHFAIYRNNHYARLNDTEQILKLGEYAQRLSDNAETLHALNSIHASLLQLNLTPETNNSIEKLSDYRKKFSQLAENLDATTDLPALTNLRQHSQKLVSKLSSQLDAIIVCAGLCPTDTINEKQKEFSDRLNEGIKQLKAENQEIVERYSPAEYILLLQ